MSNKYQDALNEELEKLGCLDAEGQFRWPDDPQKSAEAARLMLGSEWISSMDYWLDHGREFFQNTKQGSLNSDARTQREAQWRETLATLSSEQREAVMGLMNHVMSGQFFSFLVALDQPPGMYLRLTALDEELTPVAELISSYGVPFSLGDLHDELPYWEETFSRYGETVKSDRLDREMRQRLRMAAPDEEVEHNLSAQEAENEREMGRNTKAMLEGMMNAFANNSGDEEAAKAEAMEHILRYRDQVTESDAESGES